MIRSNFKPMPADEIDDEDERCRVRHDAFVASRKPRKRPSDFWFVVCAVVFAVVIGGALVLIFTHY